MGHPFTPQFLRLKLTFGFLTACLGRPVAILHGGINWRLLGGHRTLVVVTVIGPGLGPLNRRLGCNHAQPLRSTSLASGFAAEIFLPLKLSVKVKSFARSVSNEKGSQQEFLFRVGNRAGFAISHKYRRSL
jgi:hypothetical protein